MLCSTLNLKMEGIRICVMHDLVVEVQWKTKLMPTHTRVLSLIQQEGIQPWLKLFRIWIQFGFFISSIC